MGFVLTFEPSAQFAHFSSDVYEFSFYAVGSDVLPQLPVDRRVEDTVIGLLHRFFQNSENILFYVCETLDGKQEARKRTFDRWFTRYAPNTLLKYDYALEAEGTTMHASVVISEHHSQKASITGELQRLHDEYRSYK